VYRFEDKLRLKRKLVGEIFLNVFGVLSLTSKLKYWINWLGPACPKAPSMAKAKLYIKVETFGPFNFGLF
jgi:hypothetical protein